MRTEMTFDQIVGLADGLTLPQKESLMEILSRRMVEQRRATMRRDLSMANREFKTGKCRKVSATDLMQEITR